MVNEYPKDLQYTQAHVWVKVEEKRHRARVGITEELAEKLREILSIDMPMVGDELEMDEPCLHLHRDKSIHSLASPLTGRITEINKEVLDKPGLIFLEPYVNWLFCMEYDEDEELEMLMNAHQYATYLDTL